jgi:hypothetical protein
MRDAKDANEYYRTDLSRRSALDRYFGDTRIGDIVESDTLDALLDNMGLVRARKVGALIGAINGPTYVQAPTAAPYCGPLSPGEVHRGDPGCDPRMICGEDAWNIRMRGQAGFPLPGSATGFNSATLVAQKPSQGNLQPTHVWAALFDVAIAAQPLINGELVDIKIGNTTQFLGQGMSTLMFAQIITRVPVQWDVIQSTIGADFTVGNTLPAAVTAQGYITLWGYPNVPVAA